MKLRPYNSTIDYPHIEKWIDNERVHALWCANLLPYPMTKDSLDDFLRRDAEQWGSNAYVATEDNGTPIGFFSYSANTKNHSGFLKFVLLNNNLREKGYGTQMLKLALKYAFDTTDISSVQLNVFDVNNQARACYKKVGFTEKSTMENAFQYKNEQWGRCNMIIFPNKIQI